MFYILFAAQEPANDNSPEHRFWQNFGQTIAKTKEQHPGVQVIGPNAVLIDRKLGLRAYDVLVVEANKQNLDHQTLFLESETDWRD